MKFNRMNNLARNTAFSVVLVIYHTIVPFILRTAMLYFLGVEYLGLNGLFASIIQMLNIAELGVESAIVFSFYKPIADDDRKTICALMKLYKKYYRVIGLFIVGTGLLLLPLVPKLIQDTVPPDLNIYLLYLLYLAATAASYLVVGYKKCILKAHMRNDVISKVSLVVFFMANTLQVVAICMIHSYYLYLTASVLEGIVINLVSAIYTKRMYPDYKPGGQLASGYRKQISRRIRDLFLIKISDMVLNSSDVVIISMFLGLTTLAVYQNYYFILIAVVKLVQALFESAMAGIGNSLVTESQEKNYGDFERMTFAVFWIIGWCASCLLCLYQPFMRIWVGEELLLHFGLVILFVCYFVVLEMAYMLNTYKDAAGIWHKDRFRPLTAVMLNLILNIWAVQHIGLYGVLISSIIAVLGVEIPWLLHNVFSLLFLRKHLRRYVKLMAGYVIWTTVACVATFAICNLIPFNGWGGFVTMAVLCSLIPNLIFLIAYHNKAEFRQWVWTLKVLWSDHKRMQDTH